MKARAEHATPPASPAVRLHVAMLGSMPPERGISAYCLAQAEAVARQAGVSYIAFRRMYPRFLYPGGGLQPDHTFPPVRARNLHIRRRLTWYNPATWLWEGLRTPGQLLHAQVWSLPALPMCLVVMALFRLRGKPVVCTLHNLDVPEHGLVYRALARWAARLAQAVVVHTPLAAQRCAAEWGLDSARLHVIPHGLLDLYHDPARDRETARRRLGIPPDAPCVLFFGAIRPHKGLDVLLAALATVRARLPNVRLVVAGKLWEPWERYQRLIDQGNLAEAVTTRLDYVPTDEVGWLFAAADVVALPYRRFDAQSGVGLSALAWGRPLVVSDLGGLGELVRNDQYRLPPGDAPALAQALATLLGNPAALVQAAEDSRQLAGRFAWEPIAEKTVALYGQVLAKQQGTPGNLG